MEDLRGHCEVLLFPISETDEEKVESELRHDNFYILADTLPPVCRVCESKKLETDRLRASFLADFKALRSLDIFSGSGGLTCGLDASPAIQTNWAIEKDFSAASTFRCVCFVLKRVFGSLEISLIDRTSPRSRF